MTSQFEPTPEEWAALDAALDRLRQHNLNKPVRINSPEWNALYEVEAARFPFGQKRDRFKAYFEKRFGASVPACQNTKLTVVCGDYPKSGGNCTLCGRPLKI